MGWSALCAAVLVGLGGLVRSVVFRTAEVSLARSFFWGLVAAMVFLFAWHLTRPIDGWASATLTLVSLEGWRRHGRALRTSARAQLTHTPFAVATFIGFWLVLPRLGMQPLTCVDAGLYFVAAIEWHSLLPYIPGLQATQPYATLNSGGFLLMSAAGVGPFAHQGYLLFNGLLAWWGLPVAVGAVEGLCRTGKQSLLAIAFAAAPGVDALVSDRMACPSLDIGVFWLGVMMTFMAVRARWQEAAAFLILAPLYKLSLAPFGLSLLVLLLWRQRSTLRASTLLKLVGASSLATLPWILGNIVTSGYPLYPSTLFALPFDWTLPEPVVRQVGLAIQAIARNDGLPGDGGPWVRLERLLLMNRQVLLPGVALLLATIALPLRRSRDHLVTTTLGWAFVATWFVGAPEPRFAGAGLWAWAGLSLATALQPGAAETSSQTQSPGGRGALVLTAMLALFGDVPFMRSPPMPNRWPVRPGNGGSSMPLPGGGTFFDATHSGDCFVVPCGANTPVGLRQRDPLDATRGYVLPPDSKPVPLLGDTSLR